MYNLKENKMSVLFCSKQVNKKKNKLVDDVTEVTDRVLKTSKFQLKELNRWMI